MPDTHKDKVLRTEYRWRQGDSVLPETNILHVPTETHYEALSVRGPNTARSPSPRKPANRTE